MTPRACVTAALCLCLCLSAVAGARQPASEGQAQADAGLEMPDTSVMDKAMADIKKTAGTKPASATASTAPTGAPAPAGSPSLPSKFETEEHPAPPEGRPFKEKFEDIALDNDMEAKGRTPSSGRKESERMLDPEYKGEFNHDAYVISESYIAENELQQMALESLVTRLGARKPIQFGDQVAVDSFTPEEIEQRLADGKGVNPRSMTRDQLIKELRKEGLGDPDWQGINNLGNMLDPPIREHYCKNQNLAPKQCQAIPIEEIKASLKGEEPAAAASALVPSLPQDEPHRDYSAASHGKWIREKNVPVAVRARELDQMDKNTQTTPTNATTNDTTTGPDCTRMTWDEVWSDYIFSISDRNPYLKEYLDKDTVLQEYYRHEWNFDDTNNFRRAEPQSWPGWMQRAHTAKAAQSNNAPNPLSAMTKHQLEENEGKVSVKGQHLQDAKKPPPNPTSTSTTTSSSSITSSSSSSSSSSAAASTAAGAGRGTRPVAGVFEAGNDARFKVRTLFRIVDQIFSLMASLVSPPWVYVWLAAYLLNESRRV